MLDGAEARVREALERIAEGFGVDATVEVSSSPDEVVGSFTGPDAESLIGDHGQTIDAIQHLVYRVAFKGAGQRQRVVVDAGGYRERRASALKSTADEAVEAAVRSGRPVVLEPMSASERRVVHEHLKDSHRVETYSQGEEPDRRLVVAPVVGD